MFTRFNGLRQEGVCTCAVLVGATCGQSSRGIFELKTREPEGVNWLDPMETS